MAPERKAEPKLTEAAARTAGVLRALQSRLNRDAPAVEAAAEEGPEDLGNQLQEYFAAAAETKPQSAEAPSKPGAGTSPPPRVPNDIRGLVVEGVVDRVLRSWEDPNAGLSALKSEVIERLVERVLSELAGKGAPPKNAR